jgi:putative endonuclease
MREARIRTPLGRAGEAWVAGLLVREGWSLRARNFRAGPGELDIVVFRDGVLAFVEVKTRRKAVPRELEAALCRNKRHRIVETSKIFLAMHRQYSEARIRYDVFLLGSDGTVLRFEGAFTGEI